MGRDAPRSIESDLRDVAVNRQQQPTKNPAGEPAGKLED
jgi:hypothetical protein